MIYLASPYSSPDMAVQVDRHRDVLRATVALFRSGRDVYSPIVYSHPLHLAGLGGDWQTWERFDRSMIHACSFLWVLMLDGWERSKGVMAEIDIASDLNKPMRLVTLTECLALADAADGVAVIRH